MNKRKAKIKYRRAFKIACELVAGSQLFGWDKDTIFEYIIEKDGVVSNLSYEEFIMKHLDELEGRKACR